MQQVRRSLDHRQLDSILHRWLATTLPIASLAACPMVTLSKMIRWINSNRSYSWLCIADIAIGMFEYDPAGIQRATNGIYTIKFDQDGTIHALGRRAAEIGDVVPLPTDPAWERLHLPPSMQNVAAQLDLLLPDDRALSDCIAVLEPYRTGDTFVLDFPEEQRTLPLGQPFVVVFKSFLFESGLDDRPDHLDYKANRETDGALDGHCESPVSIFIVIRYDGEGRIITQDFYDAAPTWYFE